MIIIRSHMYWVSFKTRCLLLHFQGYFGMKMSIPWFVMKPPKLLVRLLVLLFPIFCPFSYVLFSWIARVHCFSFFFYLNSLLCSLCHVYYLVEWKLGLICLLLVYHRKSFTWLYVLWAYQTGQVNVIMFLGLCVPFPNLLLITIGGTLKSLFCIFLFFVWKLFCYLLLGDGSQNFYSLILYR